MKCKLSRLLAGFALTLVTVLHLQAAPQSTTFTYQGQLNAGGTLPSGQNYQFTFTLYDAATLGNVVGTPIQQQILVGSGGLFTTDLDFGHRFNAQQYWLEIKVGTTLANEQALSARQPINAVPIAQYAMSANVPTRLVFTSSATQATATTTTDSFSPTVAVLPLSGAVSSAYETATSGGVLDLSPNGSPPPQILPVGGQFGSLSAQIFLTQTFAASPGSPVTLQAQLYVADPGSAIMVPVALMCVLAPSFNGLVLAGTSANCLATGAAIPVSAGSTAVVVVSATAPGASGSNSVPMTVSVGVGP